MTSSANFYGTKPAIYRPGECKDNANKDSSHLAISSDGLQHPYLALDRHRGQSPTRLSRLRCFCSRRGSTRALLKQTYLMGMQKLCCSIRLAGTRRLRPVELGKMEGSERDFAGQGLSLSRLSRKRTCRQLPGGECYLDFVRVIVNRRRS